MSTQMIYREWSVREHDLLPPAEDMGGDPEWEAHEAMAKMLDPDAVWALVYERLETVLELRTLIEECCTIPHEPGREPRIPVSQAMRLAKEIAAVGMEVVSEQVAMRQAYTGRR